MVFVGEECDGYVSEVYAQGVSVVIDRCEEVDQAHGSIYASCYGKGCPKLYAKVKVVILSQSGFGSFSSKGKIVKQYYGTDSSKHPYYRLLEKGDRFRRQYYVWLNDELPSGSAAFLTSMLFGETEIDSDFKSVMKDLGIIHVVAISGINIRYLQVLLGVLTGKLRRKARELLNLVPLLLLFVVVGPAVSLLRGIWTMLIHITWRKNGLYPDKELFFLGLSLVLILAPGYIADAGYWLVSGASIGIYVIVPRIARFPVRKVLGEVLSSVAIWLCVAPIQWVIFHEITPIGIVVGLIIGPLIEVASVFGYLCIGLRYIPVVSGLSRYALGLIMTVILYIINVFHDLASLF